MNIRTRRPDRNRTRRSRTPNSIFDHTIRPNSSNFDRVLSDCLLRFPSGRIT
jgi:hypothetical protein